MAGRELIDEHLAALAGWLPAGVLDELADGLTETWQHHLDAGRPPADAARTAIAEFGTVAQITDAFVAQAPGRRTALVLLATGPIAGLCWGSTLIAAKVWTWPVPAAAPAAFALGLLAVVVALVAAATSRHSYRRTRLGLVGSLVLVMLDAALLTAMALVGPAVGWPVALAVIVSLARIGWTVRSLSAARL